jgi:signal transduction histidine kinase
MSIRTWLRPPRQFVALFLLVTLVPSLLLLVFGWRLAQQDRASALGQIEQLRQQAASLGASSLDQALSSAIRALRDPHAAEALAKPDDAVLVIFTAERITASPSDRLAYWPVAMPGHEAPSDTFAAGEDLEFRQQNPRMAAAWFRAQSNAHDSAVRAGALIRVARNLRKIRDTDGALAAYTRAAQISGAAVGGIPVDLLARWARCDLLEEASRSADLHAEAMTLRDDLLKGRWPLPREAYEAHLADARRWAGSMADSVSATAPERLADVVERLWNRWQRSWSAERATAGREAVVLDGAPITVLWSGDGAGLTALIAGPRYADEQWVRKASALIAPQGFALTLVTSTASPDQAETRRTAADSGLPWTISISEIDAPSSVNRTAGHQMFWFAGPGVLLVLIGAGTYIVARAVTRELAVARLQSDFVAAVSHEFRTPLTSLRQLTEILVDSRIADEARRHTYYEALQRQTARLHRLVESLLDFGRMEAGTAPYRRDPIELASLVVETVAEFQAEVADRGYQIDLDLGLADGVEVCGDRDALKNALRNLLDNAVKYSPDCRTVWVDVTRRADRFSIAVRDRGLGIPRQEQKEVFRKFVRGAEATRERIKGTGVGLAMVQHIVKAHGGKVTLDSEPARGSTFILELPMAARGSSHLDLQPSHPDADTVADLSVRNSKFDV